MGNRVSIRFVTPGKYKRTSCVLFSHWGGYTFVETAKKFAEELLEERQGKEFSPLDRLEAGTVMVDFVRAYTEKGAGIRTKGRVESDLYLVPTENDGDNSGNGHYDIILDKKKEEVRIKKI